MNALELIWGDLAREVPEALLIEGTDRRGETDNG